MSDRSVRVLYAKYNSTRRPEYRVTTEICEDAGGSFVRKRPGAQEAGEHLETIRGNGIALNDYYNDVRVIDSTLANGELRFPYVPGTTLAEQILEGGFEKERFIEKVNEKLACVMDVREDYCVPFEPTEAFTAMFGEVEFGNVPAVNPANIDSLFTNFVENETGVYCIDYEWVCAFPLPVRFICYRALLYLYVNQVHSLLEGISFDEMLDWFDFTESEREAYWQMDDRFQQIAHGENRKYVYTNRYKKNNIGIETLDRDIENLNAQIRQLTLSYETMSNSFFWRITKPARGLLDFLKGHIRKKGKLYILLRACKDVLRHGYRHAGKKFRRYIGERKKLAEVGTWPSKEVLAQQSGFVFPREITFSIVVPLYNTPKRFLREMIGSILEQTYDRWELCLADGSSDTHDEVGRICQEFAAKDERIRYRRLKKNLGISENTNACIEMATGDYIVLLDHDDLLHPSALFENMKAICESDADFIYSDEAIFQKKISDTYHIHFKSDYGPDTLRSYNYICHLTVFKKALLDKIGGGFRHEFDGSQDYDMVLRLTEQAQHIVHIPKVLYYWRSHPDSVASGITAKPYTVDAGKAALAEHLRRVGLSGTVIDSRLPSTYRIQYNIEQTPLVSIVIPNMDHADDLKKCIDSIVGKSTWTNWEIVVVENNSTEDATFEYYRSIEEDPRIQIVTWKGGFNFSGICNLGAKHAKGDYILLLNNDIEVITPNWLEEMLMFAQRSDIGAVGPMLYYPDDTIQHAGLIVGIGGSAGHSHKGFPRGDYGYLMRLTLAQNLSGVTGACCMVPRRVWEEIGGLDESFAVAFNDVDLCLRIRRAGYLIAWTPYAELYHYESKSRGYEDTPEKMERFQKERTHLRDRWGDVIDAGDPYYNPNLTLDHEDFRFR